MSKSPLSELVHFLKHEKAWWIVPLVLLAALVVIFLLFAGDGPLSEFLYPVF